MTMVSCLSTSFIKYKGRQSGFSLIEVAIALAIIGILLIPAIQIYARELYIQKIQTNQSVVDNAATALSKYVLLHGRYPFPATPGDALGSATYGAEAIKPGAGWPDCQDVATLPTVVCASVLNTAVAGKAVLVGNLPFAELGLPQTSAMDYGKNLLTYIVTEDLTNILTYTETGGVVRVLEVDDILTPAVVLATGTARHFAVVGHGDDARGSFAQNGLMTLACGTAADSQDFENCNRDGTVRSNHIVNTVGASITFLKHLVNEAPGVDHFDDFVAERNSSTSGIWSYLPDPANPDLSIRDRVGGNIATGNCDGRNPCIPVSRMDIYGDGSAVTPAVRANLIRTKRFCSRGNAFGDIANSGSSSCVDDYTKANNTAGADQTTCIDAVTCPAPGAVWNAGSLPPWFTPQLILGTPPVLGEGVSYWISSGADHTSFHRGNGIACVGDRALNGIFDYDEDCNDTSHVSAAARTTLSSCGGGTYARGLNADGSLFCQLPADNL